MLSGVSGDVATQVKKKKVDFKYFNGLLVCQKKAHKKPTQNHFIVMTITSD